jgi:hypothetical protein
MKVLLNGQDYSSVLSAAPPLSIVRTLNKPSQCNLALQLGASALPMPQRNQSLAISADNGTVLFTGYIVSDPVQELAGQSMSGPEYLTHCSAWSEEYALDRQPLPWINQPNASGGVAQGAGTMLAAITARLSSQGIAATVAAGATVGCYHPRPGTTWSQCAGDLAAASRSAYRVHDAVLSLTPVGTVQHSLDSGTLVASSIEFKSTRVLANDVTLSGAEEPDCYALELFQGDGATTVFDLTRTQFAVRGKTLLDDSFTASALNLQTWQVTDPGSHLSLGSGGLAISGGTGSDGQTTLSAIDPVELGGTIVLEAGNVQFAAGSTGIVCGLYSGIVNLADCFAGFRVRSSNGALLLVPVVNGVETGTVFTMAPDHAYTVRIRLHSPELIRSLATYYSLGSEGVLARGGGLVGSACSVEFELQDSASAPDTPATVLYDGAIGVTPATATFCAVNSTDLQGITGYFSVTRPTTAWVTSIPPGGTERTRRIGIAADGAECKVSSGKLTFYTAATPVAGELIKLRYRTSQRAVARLASASSQQQESANQPANGVPGIAQWAGRVEKPVARCSADCEAAAQAVLDFATNTDAAWEARAAGANLHQQSTGDVWPGDVVSIAAPYAGSTAPAELMVRTVTIRNGNALPELLEYSLGLANEWADCLSMTLHDTPALDAVLPQQPAVAANAVAANLPLADVTALTETSIALNLNATPPTGGGFEVRRQDAAFGNGTQPGVSLQGLVVRSPVASFTLPRAAQQEQFFVRMYDGSTPPLYSRVSAAIFTDVPLG